MTHGGVEVLEEANSKLPEEVLELMRVHLLAMEEAAEKNTESIKLSEGVGGASPHGGGT